MNSKHFSIFILGSLILAGCQTTPVNTPTQPVEKKVEEQPTEPESRIKVTPYPEHGIQRESQPLPTYQPPSSAPATSRVILPQQNPQPQRNLKDGRGIAAYQQLMQDYMQSLRQNNLSTAESYLIQAQRIAPQSADVYRELARLANIKKQGANAEALARKGLTYAQNNTQRKLLWQQILQSAQLRNNAVLIQQAQQNIDRY